MVQMIGALWNSQTVTDMPAAVKMLEGTKNKNLRLFDVLNLHGNWDCQKICD
jgi:hypothetical protein